MDIQLPTLYKRTSTGAIVEWDIETQGDIIHTTWGKQGGKKQRNSEQIALGKNIGRSNETTPEQQARLEAKSRWEKKLKKDYVDSKEKALAGDSSDLVKGGVLPMLAHRYDKHPDKIKFPCYVQPKLDGHRCLAVVKHGKCTLWSRTRKPITSMPHIVKAIEAACPDISIVLDGELYNHGYKDKFEEITSLIRPAEPKPDHYKVHYHVYDIVSDEPFSSRTTKLEAWQYEYFAYTGYKGPLRIVETGMVTDEQELMAAFKRHTAAGYEGAIVRNRDGVYVNKRSYDLQKIKQFDDAEFQIIGVSEGRGKLAGHAIFCCSNGANSSFDCKMAGAIDQLKQYWEDPTAAIGKMVTVQYQGLTGKNKVPRFPVALRIREDI